MNTSKPSPKRDTSNNDRLRVLIDASGLTQVDALERFNRDIGLRPIAMSTWKGYFVKPDSTRWRGFDSVLLGHAEKVFAKGKRKR